MEDRDKYNVDDYVNIGEALHDFDESDHECDEVRDVVEQFSDKAGVKLARDLEDLEVLVEDKEDKIGKVVVVIGDLDIENIFQEKSLYSRVLEQVGNMVGKTKLFAKGISWERLEPGNQVRTKVNNADLEGVTMDCVVQVVVWVQGTLNKVSYKENPLTGWKEPGVGANRELDICGGSDTGVSCPGRGGTDMEEVQVCETAVRAVEPCCTGVEHMCQHLTFLTNQNALKA